MKGARSLDLIEKIRAAEDVGDVQAAQEELYRRVEQALLDRLRQRIPERLQSRLDVEDVLQEAFLRAMTALDSFHSTSDNAFFA